MYYLAYGNIQHLCFILDPVALPALDAKVHRWTRSNPGEITSEENICQSQAMSSNVSTAHKYFQAQGNFNKI